MNIGTISNINNKYVVLGDKRFIENTNVVKTLMPHDIVEYNINSENKINIVRIVERTPQIICGIVKSIGETCEIFCVGLPKSYSPIIKYNPKFNIESVLLLKVDMNDIQILDIYDSIRNRKIDDEIILKMYNYKKMLCPIKPECSLKNNNYYTDGFQDLTHLQTFNVDPTLSKDFDDALSLDPLNNKIYVHIVDADEQIKESSNIDIQAFISSFTLYLPNHVENILPKDYAENKLSLVKGKKRKTITVEFVITPETQNVLSYKIYKSEIIIKNRYDYNEFNSIISEFPQLVNFYERWKKPTINVPHLKMNINKNTGLLDSYTFETNFDIAHKIIETLMVLTNMTISKHIPEIIPQRYHCKNKKEFQLISISGNEIIDSILSIKQYRPAMYDSINEGHFGLGLKSYTHFTSPIRRYFDVIIHRILAGYEYQNLLEVLEHINKQELYVEKIVKHYGNLKIISYLDLHKNKSWKGYVISKTDIGVVVILEDLLYEIFIFKTTNVVYQINEVVYVKINSIKWTTLDIKAIIL